MYQKLQKMINYSITSFYYRLLLILKNRSRIMAPLKLDGVENFSIGKRVLVNRMAWLAAMPLTGDKVELIINDGTYIGNFAHIYATQSICIGKNVLIADKVYISDNLHGYENIDIPIKDQPVVQNGKVFIDDDSWIGENVCIIGAKIGKHCVIGANAVVTKDIPDYCVAVGNPAKIIKKFDPDTKKWVKI